MVAWSFLPPVLVGLVVDPLGVNEMLPAGDDVIHKVAEIADVPDVRQPLRAAVASQRVVTARRVATLRALLEHQIVCPGIPAESVVRIVLRRLRKPFLKTHLEVKYKLHETD